MIKLLKINRQLVVDEIISHTLIHYHYSIQINNQTICLQSIIIRIEAF